MDPAFWQSLRSFRPRISTYTVRPGDTWQSIAEREGRGLAKPTTLAMMNGHAVTDQPRPGQRLKIVVAG
jgi:predicted Zn-dependent protease